MEKEEVSEFLTFWKISVMLRYGFFIKYKFNQITTIDLNLSFRKIEIKNATITFYKTQFIKY